MTLSNGNIFLLTGPLCGEFTGPGEFPTQRPVTRSFDVFFDLRLNKPLIKQPRGWWFETLSWSLWCHCNVMSYYCWHIPCDISPLLGHIEVMLHTWSKIKKTSEHFKTNIQGKNSYCPIGAMDRKRTQGPVLLQRPDAVIDPRLAAAPYHSGITGPKLALRWRHNECDSVSNHQPHDCLLNRLSGRRWK